MIIAKKKHSLCYIKKIRSVSGHESHPLKAAIAVVRLLRGHVHLVRDGHLHLATTMLVRIMYVMLNINYLQPF